MIAEKRKLFFSFLSGNSGAEEMYAQIQRPMRLLEAFYVYG